MEITEKESTPKKSCDDETKNLQPFSDFEEDNELFEDCLNKSISPSKSNTSADSNPSSEDTYCSALDIENTAVELDHISISGDVAPTANAIDTEIEKPLSTLSICSLPSNSVVVIPATSRPVLQTCTENKVETVPDTLNPFCSQSFSSNSPEHLDLNNFLPQTFHGQSLLNSAPPHTSADHTVSNSTVLHTSTSSSVLNNVIFPNSVDSSLPSSSTLSSSDLLVINAIPDSSIDQPVSNSSASDSSTNLLVINHPIQHTSEFQVSNNSVVDTSPEHQFSNNSVVDASPEHKFSNDSVADTSPEREVSNSSVENQALNVSSRQFSGRPEINITICHTFPEHPVVNYRIYQNIRITPIVNTTLTHRFSELPVLNVVQSRYYAYDPLPTLFNTFSDFVHRPLLHINLDYSYPEHLALHGFFHNSSGNPVFTITLSHSFSEHPVLYNNFNRIYSSHSHPGPSIPNNNNANFRNFRPVLNEVVPQVANPNYVLFVNSLEELPPGFQDYSAQKIYLRRPVIRQYPSPANPLQRYPSQQFPNIPVFPAPAFPNQPAYLQPGVVVPLGYPVHAFPPQNNNNLQFPQQRFPRHQAGYHWAERIEADSDTDQEGDTDTDQGVYTDTDQGEHTDQEAPEDE